MSTSTRPGLEIKNSPSTRSDSPSAQSSAPTTPQLQKTSRLVELLKAVSIEIENTSDLSLDETIALQGFLDVINVRKKGSEETGNELVYQKWSRAASTELFGTHFYEDFFSSSEALEDAFFESADIRVQADLLVKMMTRAIALVNKPAQLQQLLEAVGAKHAMYGAEPHHYELVGRVFDRALKAVLGPEFDEHFAKEWNRVYNSVAAAMIRASQTEGALQWKRRSTKQRLEAFSRMFDDVLTRAFDKDIQKFCNAWLSEAVRSAFAGSAGGSSQVTPPSSPFAKPIVKSVAETAAELAQHRGIQKEVVQSAWGRAVSAITIILTSRLRAAAQYNDLSQLAQGAIRAAPHVLIWLRTVMDPRKTDRQQLHSFVSALKTIISQYSSEAPLTKFKLTIISLFVNYLYESLHSQMLELQRAVPYTPLTTPFAMLITDVEGSAHMFDLYRSATSRALKQHMSLIRELTKQYKCSEVRVKTIGDSFMIAGADMSRIIGLALALQVEQEKLPVMAELAKYEEQHLISTVKLEKKAPTPTHQHQQQQHKMDIVTNPASTNQVAFSGSPRGAGDSFAKGQLRIKCCIHWCVSAVAVGTTNASASASDTFDYVGPDVSVPLKMLPICHGGSVMMTGEAATRLKKECPSWSGYHLSAEEASKYANSAFPVAYEGSSKIPMSFSASPSMLGLAPLNTTAGGENSTTTTENKNINNDNNNSSISIAHSVGNTPSSTTNNNNNPLQAMNVSNAAAAVSVENSPRAGGLAIELPRSSSNSSSQSQPVSPLRAELAPAICVVNYTVESKAEQQRKASHSRLAAAAVVPTLKDANVPSSAAAIASVSSNVQQEDNKLVQKDDDKEKKQQQEQHHDPTTTTSNNNNILVEGAEKAESVSGHSENTTTQSFDPSYFDPVLISEPTTESNIQLRGVQKKLTLLCVCPSEFSDRVFPPIKIADK